MPNSTLIMGSLSALKYDIDDYCGTPPHKIGGPRLQDALVAVAIDRLSDSVSDAKLKGQLKDASAALFSRSIVS